MQQLDAGLEVYKPETDIIVVPLECLTAMRSLRHS